MARASPAAAGPMAPRASPAGVRPALRALWVLLCGAADVGVSTVVTTPVPLAAQSWAAQAWRRSSSGTSPAARELLSVVLAVLADGLPASRSLAVALRNESWAAEYGKELSTSVQEFQSAWAAVQRLSALWEQHQVRSRAEAELVIDKPLEQVAQPLLAMGLVCAAVAASWGRRPFDLFSADVHSRAEVALSFTIATFVSMSLANTWTIQLLAKNPLVLYVGQLVMCFLSTTATVPIVVGGHRKSPPWLAYASLAVVLWFLTLWLTSDASIIRFAKLSELAAPGERSWESSTGPVITLLGVALLAASGRKVAYVLGSRRHCVEPFYVRHERDCVRYLRARLGARGTRLEAPTHLPTALLVGLLGVGSFMCVTIVKMACWSISDYEILHNLVLGALAVWQPLFKWADAALPLEDMSFALTRSLVCFQLALACAACYVAWLLRTVVHGYRRLFSALMRAEPYQGRGLAEQCPGVFHAMWGTYFAGALIGNCMMAFAVVGCLVFGISLMLSLGQFWSLMWSARDWYILYGLLYVTRYCIFRWVIPRYVVTDEGAVQRRRVWALLFPTLMLLNFVVGATSGVLRFVVMLPFMLVDFFRVDKTFLPEHLVDWDWSFQPFVSLVTHAHSRLNPVMFAVVTELASASRGVDHGARADEASADAWAAASGGGAGLAAGGAGDIRAAPLLDAEEVGQLAEAAEAEERRLAACRSRRARGRWYLAVTLARNPALVPLRKPQSGTCPRIAHNRRGAGGDAVS